MIFQHTWQSVLDGTKTQTRRLRLPRHWTIGNTYSVQPGRTQKAVGRVVATDLRQERLQNITKNDAQGEGFDSIAEFAVVWDRINDRAGCRWTDNPLVWVLSFELAGD